MIYEKAKKLLLDDLRIESKDIDDEVKNTIKQIDHFFEHFKEDGSPLKWLPIEYMTAEELAEITHNFLNRDLSKNRLLFKGLSYKGMKYDYGDLQVVISKNKDEQQSIYEEFPELKDYEPLDIASRIFDVNVMLVGAKQTGYQKTVETLSEVADDIFRAIWYERECFAEIGIVFINTEYSEQYIQVCERICLGTLYFMVIANENVQDKLDALKKIEESFNNAIAVYWADDVNVRKAHMAYRYAQNKVEGFLENQADRIIGCYIQYLNRRDYYQELENIEELIRNEKFSLPLDEKVEEGDEIETYISEGKRIPDFDKKLDECKKLIDFSRKHGNIWGDAEDARCLKVCMHEGYVSKVTYKRKKAMTVIRNILAVPDAPLSKLDIMFLDMKMILGVFRERGMIEEYDVFIRISRSIRKAFLFSYSALDDEEIIKMIRSSCYKFLSLFDVGRDAKLKLE